MHRLPVIRVLLEPSLFSGVMTMVISLSILGAAAWSYISVNELLYAYLFGPHGIETVLVQSPDRLGLVRQALASATGYYLAVVAAGVVVGYAVYGALETAGKARQGSAELVGELRTMGTRSELFARLWARVLGVAAWACYWLFFSGVLVPFAIMLLRMGIDSFAWSVLAGAGYCIASCVLLAASVHIHVVFLRLSLLRYRVFGGTHTLVEEELSH